MPRIARYGRSGTFPAGSTYIVARISNAPTSKRHRNMDSRETGKVKWFNPEKGYGFIERDAGGDVFVHHSEIRISGFRTLEENQRVEFTVTRGQKGNQAQDVDPT